MDGFLYRFLALVLSLALVGSGLTLHPESALVGLCAVCPERPVAALWSRTRS